MGQKRVSGRFQNILAVDASTSRASVALFADNVLYEENIEATSLHAQALLPMIERLLSQANLTPGMLEGLVFGRGPGSFTGLRIACSIVKGLAYAHDLPLYPVSDLAAIARQVFQSEHDVGVKRVPVLAAIDARMNQLYWAYYPNIHDVTSPEYVTFAEELIIPVQRPFLLAGVGLHAYEKLMPKALLAQTLKICDVYPCARALISIAQTTPVAAVDAEHAAPVYIRNHVTHGDPHG